MDLEIVTIGNELLLGFTLDSNGADIAQMLSAVGGTVVWRTTVPDEAEPIRNAVTGALDRTGFVICTGGLGPTRDDITKKTIAQLFDAPLELDEVYLEKLRVRFAKWRGGQPMPESNRTQAEIPRGATVLPNRWGTAPGLWMSNQSGDVIMLPGVPREMKALLQHEVIPRLRERVGSARVIRSRTLRCTGISESDLADRLANIDDQLAPVTLAYLPGLDGVDLRLTAWHVSDPEADSLLARGAELLSRLLENVVYPGDDVAAVVLDALRASGWTLATAESCTGGLVAARLTAIPGASEVFLGGAVTYGNQAKTELLGVEQGTLDAVGAVSAETVLAMAHGVTKRFGADVGVAVTGIAGPEGGTDDKPVGTVHLAVVGPKIEKQIRMVIPGARAEVRARAAQAALNLLRRQLRS